MRWLLHDNRGRLLILRNAYQVLSDIVQLQIKFTHALHMILKGYKEPLESELMQGNYIKSGDCHSLTQQLLSCGAACRSADN